MAQEPETEKNASGIAHAAKRKWGYDAEQVDAFLERAHMLYEGEGAQLTQHDIQNVSFELVKGGYVIAQVDAALARLERAVVDKQTTWEISQHGRVAWKAQTEDLFKNPLHPYTKGLLDAVPIPSLKAKKLSTEVMRGELTSPVDPAPGCRFAARCPYATDACRGRDIPLKEVEPGHFVSCTRF